MCLKTEEIEVTRDVRVDVDWGRGHVATTPLHLGL
jgi:hypothetical protein